MMGGKSDGKETKSTMTKARQIENKGEADLFGQIVLLERQKLSR